VGQIRNGIVGILVEIERLRTIDRYRNSGELDETEAAERRAAACRLMDTSASVPPFASIVCRASRPLPEDCGTLTAIHLMTAEARKE